MQNTHDLSVLLDLYRALEPHGATARLAAFDAAVAEYSSRSRPEAHMAIIQRLRSAWVGASAKEKTRGRG